MGLFNQTPEGRVGIALTRLFGLLDANAVPTLGPEIIPIAIGLPDAPENYLMRGERRYCTTFTQAGGATSADVQLRNPVGSGMLLILEALDLTLSVSGNLDFGIVTTLGTGWAGPVTARSTDLRLPVSVSSVGIVEGQNNNGFGGTGAAAAIHRRINWNTANNPAQLLGPYVLAPGTSVTAQSVTVASALITTWYWRERKLGPFEGTP